MLSSTLLRFSVLLVIVSASITLPHSSFNTATNNFNVLQQPKRLDWWLRKYADPALGEIPYERLEAAGEYADNLLQNSTQNRSGLTDLQWQERGPSNLGGHVNAFCFDKRDASGNTVFVASNGGGLWKSTNAFGTNAMIWAQIGKNTLPSKISSIAQDPTQKHIFYLSSYAPGGIWKSTDGGTSWVKIRTVIARILHYSRIDMEVLSDGTLIVMDQNRIYRSADGGTSFTTPLTGITMQDLELAPNGNLFALTGVGVYRSTDKGLTWILYSTGFSGNNYFSAGRIACAPSNANRMYIISPQPANNYAPYRFFRSDNGSASWYEIPVAAGISGVTWASGLAVDPFNADRLFVGSLDFSASSNGGWTTNRISTAMHVDQQCIAFSPNSSSKILFGNDGGVFRTSNGNNYTMTIEDCNANLPISEAYSVCTRLNNGNDDIISGTQDNGTFKMTQNGFAPVSNKVAGGDGGFCHIDENEPNIQVASLQNNIQLITNNNWQTTANVNIDGGEFIAATAYQSNQNVLYTPQTTRNGYAFVAGVGSTNQLTRVTFPALSGVIFYNLVSSIDISPNTSNTIYIGNADGYIFKVQNANSLSPIVKVIRPKVGGSRAVSNVAVEKGNENHLVAAFSNFGVVNLEETFDGGNTWVSVEGNLPDLPVNHAVFVPNAAQKMLIATDLGVWATEQLNGAATIWLPINTGFDSKVQTMRLEFRKPDNRLFAATYGRGIFSSTYFEQPVTPPPPTNSDLSPIMVGGAGTVIQGQNYALTYWAKNMTDQKANASLSGIYLSRDVNLDANDPLVGVSFVPELLANTSLSLTANFQIPANTAPDAYYLLVKLDYQNQLAETDEYNNQINKFIIVATQPNNQNYCAATSAYPWEDWLARVQVGNLNHTSGKSVYSDFSSLATNLMRGTTYQITLGAGYSYYTHNEFFSVWIDLNQNKVFEDSENLFRGILSKPADGLQISLITGQMTLPANAILGNTRMRVAMTRGGFPAACGTLNYGEVEDFTVTISGNSSLQPTILEDENSANAKAAMPYPNPAGEQFYLNLENNIGEYLQIQLIDLQGNIIKKWETEAQENEPFSGDLRGVQNGVYLLKIESKTGRTTVKKLVVGRNY